MQRQIQHIREVEEQLKTNRQIIHNEDRTFRGTSITDHVSEAEVLNIVCDPNECIYQGGVSLTEELEKLEPPPITSRMDVER